MSNTIHDSITLTRRFGLVFCAAATFWLWPSAVLAQANHSLTVTAGTEQITVQHSAEWFSNKQFQNMEKLVHVSGNASIKVTTEQRQSHAEAVQRVREIGAGLGAPSSAYLVIGGWPGFQHTGLEEREQPSKGPQFSDKLLLRVTTCAAVGNLLVRIDAILPSNADQGLIKQAQGIGRSLAARSKGDPKQVEGEVKDLQANPGPGAWFYTPLSLDLLASPEPAPGATEGVNDGLPGASQRIFAGGNGELEIAVSPNAQVVVIGRQSAFRTSNDGGQTFPFSGFINAFNSGDPSLAYGLSGSFYYAGIDGGCQAADAAGPFGYTCTGMARSTDNGQTFPLVSPAVICPNNNPAAPPNQPGFCFPDQEHIAADRFNPGTGGGDQVYSTWRNFDATDQDPGLVCSQDGGATWSAPITVGAGSFPRITVGQDGFVYVAYISGGNYMLHKYSSCATGLIPQPGFPLPVAPRIPVVCPFPGHDRCDQNPSSQTVAVDDTNPNHIYFAFAQNTGPGNEDIIVRDSLDGGLTWPPVRSVRANNPVASPRIMPWMSTSGGEAYLTWYDRRSATPCPVPPCPARNDSTDYYGGRVHLDALGNLVAEPDFRISDVADPWCGNGTAASWPCLTRGAPGASESCSLQPQLAGQCCVLDGAGNCTAGSSRNRCDFSDAAGVGTAPCLAGEVCVGGGGCPKYGDYNGNAAIAGRLFAGWASAAAPPGTTPSGAIDIYFSVKLIGNVSQIQIPSDVVASDTCVGESSFATLYVCNTGTANLEVGRITSTNSQFTVLAPSGGYPVIVSPDFCFPFRVRFTPTSAGNKTTVFLVPSNDPTSPTNRVMGFGKGLSPDIAVFMANAGNFGEVCVGDFKDLNLTINNPGGCSLLISNITSTSPDFIVPVVMNYPLVVHPGDSVAVPIRFQPTTLGPKAGSIAIITTDASVPNRIVNVSGQAPPGDVRVTGSADFGEVCAGSLAEKTISVCNVGKCNLSVLSVTFNPSCANFTLINNPFPAIVSPDSCMDAVIRYTPTSCGAKTCTLVIQTDDPDTPTITLTVTASTPCGSIDVPPDMAFPPTVISSFGPCRSLLPFPISNTGTCPLWITDIQIGGPQAAEYSMVGLPSFPIILEQGHIVGEGDFSIAFSPAVLARERHATITVTYIVDPVSGATASVTRQLCGEGVHTGARVLVMQGNIPVAKVEKIQLQRINANRNKDPLDTHDVIQDAPLVTSVPGLPCEPFQYHREYGTVSNPIQLLPGSYQVTVAAIINGKRKSRTVGFDVETCTFNPTVVIKY